VAERGRQRRPGEAPLERRASAREMLGSQGAQGGFGLLRPGGDHPERVGRRRPTPADDGDESRFAHGAHQAAQREATMVRHPQVAGGNRRAMAVEDIQRADRTCRGLIGRFHEFILGNQFGNGLQVRTGDDSEPLRTEDAVELLERYRDFMRVEMLDVVRGIERVHAGIGNQAHVGDGADDVGLHRPVDVEPAFLPGGRVEAGRGPVLPLPAATYMQEICQGFPLQEPFARATLRSSSTCAGRQWVSRSYPCTMCWRAARRSGTSSLRRCSASATVVAI